MKDRWLRQEWVHAHEEDTSSTRVFRPKTFALPPSRGRRTIDLSAPGTMTEARPGPSDRPETRSGGWSVEGNTLILHSPPPGEISEKLEIVSLAPDRLVLRKS